METHTGAISGTRNGELCLNLPSIKTFIPPIQLGIRISSFQRINDGVQITMDYDYKTHSMLATSGSWFKSIWELVWYFNVWMHVSTAFQLRAVCQGDISMMSEFMHTGNFSQPDLISLNIMRMHKKVNHKLDIVLCDGKTIKVEMLMDQPGHSDIHTFPTQRPTPADLNLWKLALRKLSSNFHVFTVKLQEYISPPHNHPW